MFSPRQTILSRSFAVFAALLAVMALVPTDVWAQVLTIDLGEGEADAAGPVGSVAARIFQMIIIITVLSLAPSILIMMTSFTRIVVVLSFLRTAIGTQQAPPNTVMISLAMFLTLFIMAPTFQKVYHNAFLPLMNEDINEFEAFERGSAPFKEFMMRNVREEDLRLFVDISGEGPFEQQDAVPLHILTPAFMISELRRAFEIGFMLFLPFLIIDLVTASILMSMGMMMLPPVMISLPFKIIFFVLVDGWHLVAGSLIESFNVVSK